jgi:CheY-like chemotaxis protein
MKVLLVEGNSAVHRMIRQLLAHPGTWIQECLDGASAIAAYAASRADFATTDVAIKDLDGITTTQQIEFVHQVPVREETRNETKNRECDLLR